MEIHHRPAISMLARLRDLISFYGARELVAFDGFHSVATWLDRGLARPAGPGGLKYGERREHRSSARRPLSASASVRANENFERKSDRGQKAWNRELRLDLRQFPRNLPRMAFADVDQPTVGADATAKRRSAASAPSAQGDGFGMISSMKPRSKSAPDMNRPRGSHGFGVAFDHGAPVALVPAHRLDSRRRAPAPSRNSD